MNKKVNYFAAIPIYGSVLLMLLLFIKTAKREIELKEFLACFISSGLMGFFSILISVLLFGFINELLDKNTFINDYGLVFGFILGGYLMNLFTFKMVNKRFWMW